MILTAQVSPIRCRSMWWRHGFLRNWTTKLLIRATRWSSGQNPKAALIMRHVMERFLWNARKNCSMAATLNGESGVSIQRNLMARMGQSGAARRSLHPLNSIWLDWTSTTSSLTIEVMTLTFSLLAPDSWSRLKRTITGRLNGHKWRNMTCPAFLPSKPAVNLRMSCRLSCSICSSVWNRSKWLTKLSSPSLERWNATRYSINVLWIGW